MALMQDDHALGDSSDFGLSLDFGLSSDEHLSLAGLAKTRRSSKALAKAYDEAEEAHREARLQRREETNSSHSKSVQPTNQEMMQEPASQDVLRFRNLTVLKIPKVPIATNASSNPTGPVYS